MKNKGNSGIGNVSERDFWQTEQSFWEKLNIQYSFNFDCCASKDNKKTKLFSEDFESISKIELIDKTCWMNPPFSKAHIMFKHFFDTINRGVAIYRVDNLETKIWQEMILKNCDWIFIPKGRVSYTPFDIKMRGGSTRFPSALIGVGVEYCKNLKGVTLRIKN